ncbi:MAG TPA: phage baseplate assembly protein V [Ktedonobacteraceae bacterium]
MFGPTYDLGSLGKLGSSGPPVPQRFYGKYRGKVLDNIDPLFLGRIIAIVPAVSDFPLTWAMPCSPYAGEQVGFYAIPPIDANVWIEFEAGDPNKPIWVGCFWEEGQVPLLTPPPGTTILKTECITITLRDIPEGGGITLLVEPPAVSTPITINLDSVGVQTLTEALFSVNSQTTNLTSTGAITLESPDTNISGATLTVENEETNFAGATLTVENDETNFTGATLSIENGETNIASGEVSIEAGDTNIASAAVTIESAETNIASAAATIEGVVEVTGVLLEDSMPVVVIPV